MCKYKIPHNHSCWRRCTEGPRLAQQSALDTELRVLLCKLEFLSLVLFKYGLGITHILKKKVKQVQEEKL